MSKKRKVGFKMKNMYVRLISLMMVAVMMISISASVNAESYGIPDGYTVVDLCRDDPKSRAYDVLTLSETLEMIQEHVGYVPYYTYKDGTYFFKMPQGELRIEVVHDDLLLSTAYLPIEIFEAWSFKELLREERWYSLDEFLDVLTSINDSITMLEIGEEITDTLKVRIRFLGMEDALYVDFGTFGTSADGIYYIQDTDVIRVAYELFIGPQNPVNEEVEEISISV